MHAAPPVRITVGPDRVWGIGTGLLAALAALSVALWAGIRFDLHPVTAVATCVGAAIAGWAGRRLLALGHGELRWDGSRWTWQGRIDHEARPVQAIVAFDVGPWLLLRLRHCEPVAAPAVDTWAPVSRSGAGPDWSLWRAALYAPVAGTTAAPRPPGSDA